MLVPGFSHQPGLHCGSTAIRNLLAFNGVAISEELAFGLGAGACFFYVSHDELSPSRFTSGRTARLEEQFVELTAPLSAALGKQGLELSTSADPDASWAMARERIDSGRPVLLLTDLFYLDHYGNSAHYPGHAVVLAGYDERFAYLADTSFDELQRTSLEGLAKARHGQHPFYALAGHMVHLPDGADVGDLQAAVPEAIAVAARGMVEPALDTVAGLPALRRLADEIGDWPHAAADWQWCARFNYQSIERRGTGGGNFRLLYGRFLAEVGREDEAELAHTAGERWSHLAALLFAASEPDKPDAAAWNQIAASTSAVLDAEQRLWEALA